MTEPDDADPEGARQAPSSSAVLDREAARRESTSDAALARYRRRVRRQRAVYYPIVGAVVLGLVIAFVVAYLHGEAHNTRSITVADPPSNVALQAPAADQQRSWHTSDRAALGDPQYRGTVVVWDEHTVRGVNARTGEQTWSYYRADRSVCSAVQMDGIAVAVYEVAGNCDELTALDAATGARTWTRTLDFNGLPLYGRPTYQIDIPDRTLMITTPAVIYAISVGKDQVGDGENRFTYSHFGCTINSAVLGFRGALISQTCANPRCGSGTDRLKFCGKGTQLLLRGDPSEDVDTDDDNGNNPNRIMWNNFGDTDVPVSAGDTAAAGNRTTGELDLLGGDSGKPTGSVDLGLTGSAWTRSTSSTDLGADKLLVWAGHRVAFVTGKPKPVWTAASTGPPAVTGDTVVLPSADGARLTARTTGAVQQTYPLTPAAPTGSTLYRLGRGFLAASTSGTEAYS